MARAMAMTLRHGCGSMARSSRNINRKVDARKPKRSRTRAKPISTANVATDAKPTAGRDFVGGEAYP